MYLTNSCQYRIAKEKRYDMACIKGASLFMFLSSLLTNTTFRVFLYAFILLEEGEKSSKQKSGSL